MNVLFDISALGAGYYLQSARTGVARVIENVAQQLVKLDSCELNFCSYESPIHHLLSRRYLRAMPILRQIPLHFLSDNIFGKAVMRQANNFDTISLKELAIQRALHGLAFILGRGKMRYEKDEAAIVRSTDIFHATYYPFPALVRRHPNITNFITIYDLIAVFSPQYFPFKKIHPLHAVLNSITPDDWIITISNSTKNDLCNYRNIDPDRVFVTPLAASDFFYSCTDQKLLSRVRRKYKIPDDPYVLSLSTLEPRKNIGHTIRSFARLVQEQHIPDLNLVLVGTKGWDYNDIFREVASHGLLADRIIVTGFVDDEDLAAIYSGAQMFVYLSLYEGFGLPPLEAMQCGIPVITSNNSSLPEVVGDAGIMVDANDTEELCQAMNDIYRKPSLRQELSSRSLARARQFSWATCAERTMDAYNKALVLSS